MSDFGTTRDGPADAIGKLIRRALKVAMVARGLNEDDLAKELSSRSGRAINAGLVHAWTCETKHRWRVPADMVPSVCEILDDDTISELLLREKKRVALQLGEDGPRVASILRAALKEPSKPRSKR